MCSRDNDHFEVGLLMVACKGGRLNCLSLILHGFLCGHGDYTLEQTFCHKSGKYEVCLLKKCKKMKYYTMGHCDTAKNSYCEK